MKVLLTALITGYFSLSLPLPTNEELKPKIIDGIPAKRDLTFSYAATDIGSKEGTRIKTITVFKNVDDKKGKPLKIDPKLHKSEDWGSKFRDNFDAYGAIPEVPDVDELFEFFHKKEDENPKDKDAEKTSQESDEMNKKPKENDKKLNESEHETTSVSTTVASESKEEKVEKILGDAEFIHPGGKKGKVKSQSLDMGKYSVHEPMFDSDSKDKSHEKFIVPASAPYYYSKPGEIGPSSPNAFPSINGLQQSNRGSIIVTTPSGRKFDVPLGNVSDTYPYVAPTFRKPQNQLPNQQFVTSSQRPYIAPNVRKTYEVQSSFNPASNNNSFLNSTNGSQNPCPNVNTNIPTNTRTNGFTYNKPNISRSRGRRY